MANDFSYFQRRAAQERAATLRAPHPRARRAHLIMAQKYEDRIRRVPADQRTLEAQQGLVTYDDAAELEKEEVPGDPRD